MNRCLALSLLSFGLSLSCCSLYPPWHYYYVNLPMTWSDAQQYCREKYTDLATIVSMDEISRLQPAFTYTWAWIGLGDDPTSWKRTMGNDSNSWRWSATGETSKTGYQNWKSTEPNRGAGEENCVTISDQGNWRDVRCYLTRWFVCYTETNQNEKTYTVFSIPKNWTDARDYCRRHYTDLAMIENDDENNRASSAIPANGAVWIGLYRVPWTWSDKTQSSFRRWEDGQPNNGGGSEVCVAENALHEWNDIHCSAKYPFICHQGLSLSCCSLYPPRHYYYVNLPMTWSDAQQYCREKYTDLATIVSMDEISRLQPAFTYAWAWIGLGDDPTSWKRTMGNDSNSWRWSATGETSKTGYQNWKSTEPNRGAGEENCVMIGSQGSWWDVRCYLTRWFVCYTETNQNEKTYTVFSIPKNWTDARDYCRRHYTDLAMIENDDENNRASSAIPANSVVWIGLYRVPWTWSDKTQSSFRRWEDGQPNNGGGSEVCVAENALHEWNDIHCSAKYPFICHQATEVKTVMRMKIETDADLTDPAANTQILQQLEAILRRQRLTNVTLRWKIQPKKEGRKKPEPDCILLF